MKYLSKREEYELRQFAARLLREGVPEKQILRVLRRSYGPLYPLARLPVILTLIVTALGCAFLAAFSETLRPVLLLVVMVLAYLLIGVLPLVRDDLEKKVQRAVGDAKKLSARAAAEKSQHSMEG